MSLRRLEGGCHCGRIRYGVEMDLSAPTVRCNCSICAKSRAWISVVPAIAFRLLAGESEPGTYTFGARDVAHHFCPDCGVKTHGSSMMQGAGAWVAVCVATLDLAPAELASLQVVYRDGRADLETPPAITAHL